MDTGLIIVHIIAGLFALLGLVCFIFLAVFATHCIKESIERENYKSPFLYREDYKSEV